MHDAFSASMPILFVLKPEIKALPIYSFLLYGRENCEGLRGRCLPNFKEETSVRNSFGPTVYSPKFDFVT